MSVRHPHIVAWLRDPHDGAYSAEFLGFTLRVRWHPNTRDARGSFRWEVSRAGEKTRRSVDHFEELEQAMADAEEFAREDTALRVRPAPPEPPAAH
jgi:hypothetical protein